MGLDEQRILDGRYQVVPRTLCFVTHGEQVLLLRGAPDKPIWPNKYNGVGGHVEASEDVFSAARREIEEETGLAVHDLRLSGVVNIPVERDTHTGIMMFVFCAASASQEARASEEGTLEWVSPERLGTLDLVEDLPVLLPRVLSMEAGEPPFFALYTYDERNQLAIRFVTG